MTILNGGGSSGVSPKKFNQGIEDVKSAVQDVQTSVNSLSSTMQSGMSDLQDSVESVQTAVQNVPAGPLPAPVQVYSLSSCEEGITVGMSLIDAGGKITKSFSGSVSLFDGPAPYARPKGIMVRYKVGDYPKSETDGELGFILEEDDIFDWSGNVGPAEIKSNNVITGLTNDTEYYIAAFTYNHYGVFNLGFYGVSSGPEALPEPFNYGTCSYTGNKATVNVTITQDYDYKTLGEVTVTLTPSSGGSAISGSRTGPGVITLSGVNGGYYDISYSTAQYFTKPDTTDEYEIVAGRPLNIEAEYKTVVGLSNYTWDEIHEITVNGDASHFFSVGEKKQTTVKNVHGTFYTDDDGFIASGNYNNTETCYAYLVDINYHEKIGSNNANSLLFMVEKASVFINTKTSGLYWLSDEDTGISRYNTMRTWLNNKYNEIFPEIYSHICKVRNHATFVYNEVSQDYVSETEDYIFPPSSKNLNWVATLPREETSYEYFKASTQTKLLDFVKNDLMIMTRSSYYSSTGAKFIGVMLDGTFDDIGYDQYPTHGSTPDYGFVLCFAIG